MANKLSDLGGSIFYDGYDGEAMITLIADAASKAGWLVGQTSGAGTAVPVDTNANLDELDGICVERYDTDIDSVYGAGVIIDVALPKAGRRYIVAIYSAGALYAGEPMIPNAGTNAGMLIAGANLEVGHLARLFKNITAADNFAIVTWGV